jgi:hypothetical protein
MNYFCGYPVRDKEKPLIFVPCGKMATPGCAFCDEHGDAFARAGKEPSPMYVANSLLLVMVTLAIAVSVPHVHEFLVIHREFVFGVLVGSIAEAAVILLSRWAWDRWLWLRWFSHQ